MGHPLVERLEFARRPGGVVARTGFRSGEAVARAVPGEQEQEIERILPAMVAAAVSSSAGTLARWRSDGRRSWKGQSIEAVRAGGCGDPHRGARDARADAMFGRRAGHVGNGDAGSRMVRHTVRCRVPHLSRDVRDRAALVQVKHIGLVNIVAGQDPGAGTGTGRLHTGTDGSGGRTDAVRPCSARTGARVTGVIRERLGGPGASRRVAESILSGRGVA